MSAGLCARCKKGEGCRFRQPGTWSVDCNLFDEGPPPKALGLPRDHLMPTEKAGTAPEAAHLPTLPVTTTRRKTR
jgi:hypothetical protein